jgi:hypothetical protein
MSSTQATSRPSEHLLVLYRAWLDELKFRKRQQWIMTNYFVLIVAGIYSIKSLPHMRFWFQLVICFAAVFELWLLWKMQHGMEEVRDCLDAFRDEHFTADEISRYFPRPATRGIARWLRSNLPSWLQRCLRPNFCNGIEFTLMLAGVTIIAAAFVLAAI